MVELKRSSSETPIFNLRPGKSLKVTCDALHKHSFFTYLLRERKTRSHRFTPKKIRVIKDVTNQMNYAIDIRQSTPISSHKHKKTHYVNIYKLNENRNECQGIIQHNITAE